MRELKNKWYEILDNNPQIGNRDCMAALGIIDALNMACSPDCYDETLAYHIEREMKNMESAIAIAWANEVLEFAQSGNDKVDLGGFPKNTHHIA